MRRHELWKLVKVVVAAALVATIILINVKG